MVTTRERAKPPPPPPEPETRKSGRARQAVKAYSPVDNTTVIVSASRKDAGPGKGMKHSKTKKVSRTTVSGFQFNPIFLKLWLMADEPL